MIHHRPQVFDPYLSRHGVVISCAAISGGLVLSLILAFGRDLSSRSLSPNAFIRIDSYGHVFLTLPHVEAGRDGCASIQRLMSEELEITFDQVHLEQAPLQEGGFFNRMVNKEASADSAEAIRNVLKSLCEAGATARDMLIAAAAKRWDVDARSCHAHEGEVIHTTTWRKLTYGELVADAARIPILGNVVLKQ